MEKQVGCKDVKSGDIQCVMAGIVILFSVLTAVLGLESLSISGVLIFAIVCVMGCMSKDVMELCNGLTDEED